MKKVISRIIAVLFGALGTKGDTRPLQKQTAKKLPYEQRLRERMRKQRRK